MFKTYLRFELTKRHARWPVWLLIVILTGLGIAGNFQQKAAQTAFLTKYRQALVKNGATKSKNPKTLGEKIFNPELQALSTPKAYADWFKVELQIAAGTRGSSQKNFGANYRFSILNGDQVPYSGVAKRTLTQYRLLDKKKLTGYYPQPILFTKDELADMSAKNQRDIKTWFPTFYIRGFDYLQYLFQENVPFYLLLIAIIISGSFFAKELADKRAHANWLILQGESLIEQVWTQFLMIVGTMAEIIALPLVLTTIVVGLFRGFGSLQFPVLQETPNGIFGFTDSFTTNGKLLLTSGLLLLALIAFTAALNVLAAYLIRNSWLTTAVVLLITASAAIVPLTDWLPLSFFNVWHIADGSLAQSVEMPELQLWSVIRTVIFWTIGILFVVHLLILVNQKQLSKFWNRTTHRSAAESGS